MQQQFLDLLNKIFHKCLKTIGMLHMKCLGKKYLLNLTENFEKW